MRLIKLNQTISFSRFVLFLYCLISPNLTVQSQISKINTVFLIVLSDQSWLDIKSTASAPFINSLLPTASSADNYFSPNGSGFSLGNFLWLEAGTNFGVNLNPNSLQTNTGSHFVRLLENAGLTWKCYEEGIAGNSCPVSSTADYDTKYNPFIYFDDIKNNQVSCVNHIRPYNEFATDLNSNTIANYNFIRPNKCNSMFRFCTNVGDHIKQGDNWLSQEIPKIMASSAYKNGGAIFITWDQYSSDVPIGMIVLSPFCKKGYRNSIHYTHGSTLRTFQEIFGITPFLGDAANQTSLNDFFDVSEADNSSEVTITWNPSLGATDYSIKRSTKSGGPFQTIATGLNKPNYIDHGLKGGTTYFYIVTALNGNGEGPPSQQISFTPEVVKPVLPLAPTNVQATNNH